MKNKIRLILVSILVLAMTLGASAAVVSPALNVLAKQHAMIKSGLMYSDIYFSEQDFMKCLGLPSVSSVTVSSLPQAVDGTLKLGTLNITEGQTIKSEYLSLLRFVPTSDQVEYTSFNFEYNGTEIPCTLKLLDSINYAPAFAENEERISTYRNVSYFGTLGAVDPEGDPLDFQVISYPEKGTLTITDSARGSFKYTPTSGFVGDDKFIVVVRDAYGNYSSTQTVSVNVDKTSVSFTDTKGHWCENAALSLYEAGVVDAMRYQNGLVFCPDDSMSREEFITMVMKTLDIQTLTDTDTSFADNYKINIEYRPYVATAQRMGYVNGSEQDGLICFNPQDSITKAEAAVVINNILGLEEGSAVSVFADDSAIPVWARSAIYALTGAGVFNGDGAGVIAPSAILSRAQTVQMLYNLTEK